MFKRLVMNKKMSLHSYNLLNFAGQAAISGSQKNSQMIFTHGAIICKGGKKVCEGYNHKRSFSAGKLHCSFHAEIDAINRWKSIFLRGKNKYCFLRNTEKGKEI